jgi:hypothetical protein
MFWRNKAEITWQEKLFLQLELDWFLVAMQVAWSVSSIMPCRTRWSTSAIRSQVKVVPVLN